ncbi:hypothetical protein C9J19_12830 [Photobacterium phosphoreum]|uniref:hypothetical protein n=1 Tax=Photobacterium phosphoreum TaxID=659 RepID=UPI000D1548F4|nr:hypothetical protein [Photobacterium phosphoreum]PSU74235.1 hypothetical protein CTM79_01930 [Photobacterium phosphoreum]PSW17765.1 hypothetical protein C9J20_00435 [Photobacterium phosphoreum]PSW28251.1 hypothetical protein C9J19_12830 [Photobacterium phosphoreum]
MYIKRLRTIWITSFTLIALLLSSVASSAPLMSAKMLSMNHSMMVMSPSMDCCDDESMTDHQHHQAPESPSHCNKMGGIDKCCSIACISNVAFLPSQFENLSQPSNLTLIAIEKTHQLNTSTPTLYRPPIA